ncbi:tRNA-intron lyase [Halobacterium jilantaiense]|uniref:tRNA-splicing endonuclease n=1 Tax=Halobacterium jilantaiense TaxID=355548 RepID=A0A1I0PWL6_9EURY|nr:tRNA-intron lyase [Halobacterium jilantaiense]SEW18940.1 tRNA-intron endonuclease [Halobacterium jilantaiense]
MNGDLRGDEVHVGGDARQRFHDARGYGYPLGGNDIALSLVEAAHLLFRGDLEAVDGQGFRAFLADREAGFVARFLVYVDLRDRGFYLVPDQKPWWHEPGDGDFVVFPRGNTRRDGVVKHRIRVVDERTTLPASGLTDEVLAVVDEESELTYLDVSPETPEGDTEFDRPADVPAVLFDDRVLVWEPPAELHESGFYGQPLGGRAADHDALQLSLLEAAYLTDAGVLSFADAGVADVLARGRVGEGERFDRRLAVYRALRDAAMVPKTGFKFGADFRVYSGVESVDDLGHSELLVRVVETDHDFVPRDLSLDVRLAHGVRKRMVFAITDDTNDTIRWLSVSRLTP